ncbi:LPXTG cell wall anchor domain-containing protein [Enterococcus sp. AZ163]|uniref:LPXTG cell wall anchor domain-containing protein n=1 Tax=Enterococcus sp. AZ163 TaxID=2774638 RepID=UPI003D28F38B
MKKILVVTLFSTLILGTSGVTSFAAEVQQDQPIAIVPFEITDPTDPSVPPTPDPDPNPTPDPDPNPDPNPTPDPDPDPDPNPTPDPDPDPDPGPTPDPDPDPDPGPTPNPDPDPDPSPTPDPDPMPKPDPTPTPNPDPKPTPGDQNGGKGNQTANNPTPSPVNTNPTPQAPVLTSGNQTVIATVDGNPIVLQADGSTKTVTPETIGARVQKDGSLVIKDKEGNEKVLPKTGEKTSGALTTLGMMIVSLFAFILKQRKEVSEL